MHSAAGLLELLSEFFRHLTAWLPRPEYVPNCHALVRWTFRRDPVVLQGLVWVVPLFQAFERVDIRAQATEFEPKILWTKDGKEAAVGMAVVWRVADPLTLCKTVDEIETLVSKLGESVLPKLVGSFTLDEFKRKAAGAGVREWSFDTHLRKELGSILEPYGITVDSARLNFTGDRVRTIKLVGGDVR